jgi:UDP-N-acetylglucosamine acyltransferase
VTDRNSIHSTAVIGPGVVLGEGNVIAPFAVILGPCRIGDRNWIGPHVSIGTPAQMRDGEHPAAWDATAETQGITIGSDNVIREYVTIHQPTEGVTRIGDRCYLMSYAHVPHDAQIGDSVTLSNASQIGGHTVIGDGANLGLGVMVHQRMAIGSGAMVGMGSVVTRPIPPYAIAYGSPARVAGANVVGLSRAGYGEDISTKLAAHYVGEGGSVDDLDLPPALAALFAEYAAAIEGRA